MEANRIESWASDLQRWSGAAERVLANQAQMSEEVVEQVECFSRALKLGTLAVDELREGVRWANALDAEAVASYGSDTLTGEAQLERTARRVMHLAGRTALNEANRLKQRQTNSNIARNRRRGYKK